MRAVYLDSFSGLSGNMFLGALVDAGMPEAALRNEIAKINIKGFSLKVESVNKCGIHATHIDVDLTSGHHHRGLSDILQLIRETELPEAVKEKACLVFQRLGAAEAKVHGMPIEKVHFHEVGAVDAIIDIVGTVFGFYYLGIDRIYCSPLRVGRGFVKAAHGIMPIPAPATAELLHGIPWYPGDIDKELVTPTGAALVAELCSGFGDRPTGFIAQKTAYGAGTWDLIIPNVLRLSVGTIPEEKNVDTRWLLEANVDDSTPEVIAYVIDKLLAAGALDAWITPIIMKKGRPAFLISALTDELQKNAVEDVVFAETSSIGVRWQEVRRTVADRSIVPVATEWGSVGVKVAERNGQVINVAPEFGDCRALADQTGAPLKKIYQAAMNAWSLLKR
ncbi:MAG: nickel pincer cofactor biosynthesis protein LarC [Negativicutes bacterium]